MYYRWLTFSNGCVSWLFSQLFSLASEWWRGIWAFWFFHFKKNWWGWSPFKLWKVYICNCARNVTMLYLLHTFPPPNSVKGSDIKRVEGWKVWKVLLHIVGQLPVLYHALIKNLKSISPLFLNRNNYHLHAWICSCITTMVVLISYLLLLDWLKLLLMSLLLLFLNAG